MSWASRRETTRIEDEAYYLLGIFGINMPLLHGEGNAAFRRLQEELLRRSDDQSIFAIIQYIPDSAKSVLADSPESFRISGHIESIHSLTASFEAFEYSTMVKGASITSRGIELTLALLESEVAGYAKEDGDDNAPLLIKASGVAAVTEIYTGIIVAIPLIHRCHGLYTRRARSFRWLDRTVANSARLRTITLEHHQLELQRSWTRQLGMDDIITVNYRHAETSGFFRAWFKAGLLDTLNDVPGRHSLLHYTTFPRSGNSIFICFVNALGGSFLLKITALLGAVEVTLWHDLQDSDLQASREIL